MQRTPAEYTLLETVLRARAALLEHAELSADELRERLRALLHDEVELLQRRAAAANEPLLADPADTEQWLEDQVLGFGVLGPLMRTDGIQTIRIAGPGSGSRTTRLFGTWSSGSPAWPVASSTKRTHAWTSACRMVRACTR